MPELPEVETVVRSLRKTIIGKTISGLKIKNTARIFPVKRKFAELITGTTIVGAERRGKNILIELSNDHTLWIHLKMTGHFHYDRISDPLGRHDHVVFEMRDNGHRLRFDDYRRFGRIRIFHRTEIMSQPGLIDLGPEPLEITPDAFVHLFKSRRRMIKPALLDQTFIAGIGNIYADESLHLSRIHPMRLTNTLSKKKLTELRTNIRRILSKAIRLMGTSVDSFEGLNGQPGRYQKYLLAYNREGEPCRFCGRSIRRDKIGGRSSYYCSSCQRRR